MIHPYSLYRSHYARYPHIQCSALSNKTFRFTCPPVLFSIRKILKPRSKKTSNPSNIPYIRSVLLKEFSLTRPDGETHIRFNKLSGIKTLKAEANTSKEKTWKDLFTYFESVDRSPPSESPSMEYLEGLIFKPINAKTFNTFNYANELPYFTRIIRLYVRNGCWIPPWLSFHAFKAAACGNSPAAMGQYLRLVSQQLETSSEHRPLGLDAKQWDMIVKCILVTTRSQSSQSEKRLYQKRGWATILNLRNIVYENLNSRKVNTLSSDDFSVYHILVEFGVHGMSNYFRLVSRFCDSHTVSEWARDWFVRGFYDRNLPPETLNFVFNSCIQTLLAKKSPEKAWKLVQKAHPKFNPFAIQDKTWKLLFRHPEFSAAWKPVIKGPVMDALELYMSKVERQFHVKWTGGEDGFHMPRGAEYRPQ